jgi:cytochrome c-type protein NapC
LAARQKADIEAEAQKLAADIVRRQSSAPAAAAPAAQQTAAVAAAQSPSPAGTGVDWNGIEAKAVTLFYPGQASYEWVQGREHGGARAFLRAGDRCSECHAR